MRYVTSVERIGIERGREQGMELGMEQGQRKMAIDVLTRLLARRFGSLSPVVRKHLEEANLEQLDLWTDRILDAPSLEAVFEEESAN